MGVMCVSFGNRVKIKKYGARILEVVAHTVNEHFSGSRDVNMDSPSEDSGTKRPREVDEDGGWRSTRASSPGREFDDTENDSKHSTWQQSTKRPKKPHQGGPTCLYRTHIC